MNVPFADYPELHYTVSRLVKKIGFSSKIKDQTPILCQYFLTKSMSLETLILLLILF